MNQLYYCKIMDNRTGLCNQLFALVNGIVLAYLEKKQIVIVDEFLNDYLGHIRSPISEIIDLNKLNNFIKSNYGMNVLDKYHTIFTIHKVLYGKEDKQVDITQPAIDKFYKNNTFLIDTNVNLNLLGGDPCPGQAKHIEITYALNDVILTDKYDEQNCALKNKVVFNLNNTIFNFKMDWIDKYDRTIFDNILKNIVFLKKFKLPESENTLISNYNKVNVIHLRIENDAIEHWSKMNKMGRTFFKTFIEQKYINIIKQHISKNDMTVLLTYSNDNSVIQFLKTNGYKYHISPKIDNWGREINAIKDTTIIDLCNNLFVGNFNLHKLNGSSLSYFLLNKLNPGIKCITMDLDRILDPENIFLKN